MQLGQCVLIESVVFVVAAFEIELKFEWECECAGRRGRGRMLREELLRIE